MKDISVIIVNYNVKDPVDNCIASVYKANTSQNFNLEIFLVDNNSVDGSPSHIRNKYPNVNVIELKENVGFSRANNVALKQATGKYILILNPDTLLEENTFIKLINFIDKHPDTGAISSKLIKQDGSLDAACKRSFPTPSAAIPRMLGLSRLFPKSKIFSKYNLTYLDENLTHKVDAICGAFMFIPKVVFDKVGLFDEDYFMYGEDLDLCFRIKKAGYEIYYYPEVTTIHLKGESTKKTNLSYVNNFYGAMNIFVKKNFTGSSRFLSFILRLGIFYRSFFSYLVRIIFNLLNPLVDAVLIFSGLIISVKLRFEMFPNEPYLFIISVYTLIWVLLLAVFGAYTRKNKLSLKAVFIGVFSGFFVNSSVTYFFKEYAFSREVVLTSTAIALLTLTFWRSILLIYNFVKYRNITLKSVNLLVVGSSKFHQNIEDKLSSVYNVFLFDEISNRKDTQSLKEIIIFNNIDEVVFTDNSFSNSDILSTIWEFKNRGVSFKVLPSGKELILSKLQSNIDELSFIEIEYNINNKFNIFLKRFFDILISLLMLIFVYPFIWVYNRLIRNNLSRHTSKLLSLPEVFFGKYSFVGMPMWFETKGREYFGKKGLTGFIQIYYHEGMTHEEMTEYNIFYAKNQTLLLDIEIILKTIFSLFRRKARNGKHNS